MRKVNFLAALLFAVSACSVSAQTKADKLFNIPEKYVYNVHTAHLHDGARMMVEMADVTDYVMLKNLDSFVAMMQRDVDFYKDSIKGPENVRVDYAFEWGSDKAMIRFRRHQPSGDIYVKTAGELSRMKVEQDTVRLLIRKKPMEHSNPSFLYDFPVQITFLLNNFSDLKTISSEKGLINSIVDAFAKASLPKPYHANLSEHRTKFDYYPFSVSKRMVKRDPDGEDLREATAEKK